MSKSSLPLKELIGHGGVADVKLKTLWSRQMYSPKEDRTQIKNRRQDTDKKQQYYDVQQRYLHQELKTMN